MELYTPNLDSTEYNIVKQYVLEALIATEVIPTQYTKFVPIDRLYNELIENPDFVDFVSDKEELCSIFAEEAMCLEKVKTYISSMLYFMKEEKYFKLLYSDKACIVPSEIKITSTDRVLQN